MRLLRRPCDGTQVDRRYFVGLRHTYEGMLLATALPAADFGSGPDQGFRDRLLSALAVIVFQCGLEAAQHRFAVKRLVQKADRAANRGLSAGFCVWKGSDENSRYLVPTRAQGIVQLDAAHIRHLDVGNQTRGCRHFVRLQERMRGWKRICDEPE